MRTEKILAKGFTIVEMIVIIAVIGVLAAVTLVAYNGFQQDAKQTALLADLDNATSALELDLKDDGHYPATVDLTLELIDKGSGLATNSGTKYQYTVNTSTTSPSYCLTGTNGTASFYIDSTSTTSTKGGCPGDGVGGVAATENLLFNPSIESGTTASTWGYYSPPLTADSTKAVSGSYSLKTTTNSTANPQGLVWQGDAVPAGTYTCSVSLTGTAGVVVNVSGRTESPYSEGYGGKSLTLSAVFQRTSITFTLPAAVGIIEIQVVRNGPASGTTIQGDAAMCVAGTSTPNYADGNSANWKWTGTPNASTSTGPAL